MLVFIDEAWDTGFQFEKQSSHFFTIWMVIFNTQNEAEKCNQRIQLLKNELHFSENYEFHYKKDSDRIKQAFFSAVAPYDFFYYWIIVNKQILDLESLKLRESFYSYICSLLFEMARTRLMEANVIIDGGYSKSFDRNLQTYLRKKFNTYNDHKIKKVRTEDSRKNNLLQLADYITSWIHREYSSQKESYLNIIKHRAIQIQIFPKEKFIPIS